MSLHVYKDTKDTKDSTCAMQCNVFEAQLLHFQQTAVDYLVKPVRVRKVWMSSSESDDESDGGKSSSESDDEETNSGIATYAALAQYRTNRPSISKRTLYLHRSMSWFNISKRCGDSNDNTSKLWASIGRRLSVMVAGEWDAGKWDAGCWRMRRWRMRRWPLQLWSEMMEQGDTGTIPPGSKPGTSDWCGSRYEGRLVRRLLHLHVAVLVAEVTCASGMKKGNWSLGL